MNISSKTINIHDKIIFFFLLLILNIALNQVSWFTFYFTK